MPAMSWFNIRQYQNLFFGIAHAEIRQRGTLSVAEQREHILVAYKRAVGLWSRDDQTLGNITNFPICPQALKNLGAERNIVRAMLSTTATGNHSFTGESMLNKAKELKKSMLSLICIWNVACRIPGQAATIAIPGSGETLDSVYEKVVATVYRIQETERVLKLRRDYFGVEFAQSGHCTREQVEEAHVNHFYATRGYSIGEQRADTRMYRANGRGAQHAIRRSIDELVAAEFSHGAGEPVAAGRAPPDGRLRQSFTEEAQPAHWDIEERHVFRVLGPPSGALSPFYSDEWNQYRQSSNTGAFAGRMTTAARQTAADTAAANGSPQVFAGSVGNLTQVGQGRASSSNRNAVPTEVPSVRVRQREDLNANFENLNERAANQNAVAHWNALNNARAQELAQLQMAITAATSIDGFDPAELRRMNVAMIARATAPHIPPPPPPSMPVRDCRSLHSITTTKRTCNRLQTINQQHNTALTNLQVHPSVIRAQLAEQSSQQGTVVDAPAGDADRNVRPRISDSTDSRAAIQDQADTLQRLLENLFRRFHAIECGDGRGKCLFYVLRHLQSNEIPHQQLHDVGAAVDEDVARTRARIADHLERRTADGVSSPLQDPASIDLSVAMREEIEGSTADYVAWIRREGREASSGGIIEPASSGGFIELVAWADLFNVRIQLFSSTVFAEQLHDEKVNWGAVSSDGAPAQTFHVYHTVGRGGRGGHYQLLQPILPPRDEIVHVAGESPSRAPDPAPAPCAAAAAAAAATSTAV